MADHESSEINDVAPSSIRHLIGQEGVVAQVLVAMDAAFADDRRFDDALLVGPPGVGKSALAQVIACEMATTLHEVLGQSIKTPADLNGLILAAKDKDIVHIDECHELAKPYQTALYRAIDKREIVISGSRNAPYSLPLHDFTLLLSSTDEHALLAPLRDRMKMVFSLRVLRRSGTHHRSSPTDSCTAMGGSGASPAHDCSAGQGDTSPCTATPPVLPPCVPCGG